MRGELPQWQPHFEAESSHIIKARVDYLQDNGRIFESHNLMRYYTLLGETDINDGSLFDHYIDDMVGAGRCDQLLSDIVNYLNNGKSSRKQRATAAMRWAYCLMEHGHNSHAEAILQYLSTAQTIPQL